MVSACALDASVRVDEKRATPESLCAGHVCGASLDHPAGSLSGVAPATFPALVFVSVTRYAA